MSMFFGIESGIRGAEIGDSLARRADSSRFSPAQKFIDLKMAEEPFRSGVCGILAVSMNGDTLGSLTHNFLNYFTREASSLFFLSN